MNNKKVSAAIIKYACPICGKINEDATAIAINSRLIEKAAETIEKMHNQVVGFSDKPCKECQSYINKGAFFVIGINSDKTDDMRNPYRSGHLIGIKKSSKFYQHLPEEYKHKDAIFMDYREMEKVGLIQQ